MATEGLQSYVSAVSGLTRMTRERAAATAMAVLAQAGLAEVATDAQERATRLAEEILTASRANRELWQKMVASEVDRAAARVGFVRADELEGLRRELSELRLAMAYQASATPETRPAETVPPTGGFPGGPPDFLVPQTGSADQPAPSPRRTAAKTAAGVTGRRGAAKKTSPSKAGASKAGASRTSASRTGASRTSASKTSASKTSAGKASATKASASNTTTGTTEAGTARARTTVARTTSARKKASSSAPPRKRATRPVAPPPQSDPADAEVTAPAVPSGPAPEPSSS